MTNLNVTLRYRVMTWSKVYVQHIVLQTPPVRESSNSLTFSPTSWMELGGGSRCVERLLASHWTLVPLKSSWICSRVLPFVSGTKAMVKTTLTAHMPAKSQKVPALVSRAWKTAATSRCAPESNWGNRHFSEARPFWTRLLGILRVDRAMWWHSTEMSAPVKRLIFFVFVSRWSF